MNAYQRTEWSVDDGQSDDDNDDNEYGTTTDAECTMPLANQA